MQQLWWAGVCLVDLERQLLLKDGQPVKLRPKVWALLVCLVQRPNAVVQWTELLDALWPRQAIDPKLLTNLVSELRRALGDPAALQTSPRRGYMLVATPATSATLQPPAAANPVGEASAATGLGPEPAGDGPVFVGRRAEIKAIRGCLEQALRGKVQIVEIMGTAGAGKSALVEEVLSSARSSGRWSILTGRSLQMTGEREPFGPLLQMLGDWLKGVDKASAARELRRVAPCWLAQLPGLIDEPGLHELRQELRYASTGRMLRESVGLLKLWAACQPVLLVLEDIHWADSATLDWIARWAHADDPCPLALIVTHRLHGEVELPASLTTALNHAMARGVLKTLALRGLTPEETMDYLSRRHRGPEINQGIADEMARLTDGLPLYLKMLTDELLAGFSQGASANDIARKWQLGPTQFQSLLRERTRVLPARLRSLLEVASCVTVPLPLPVFARTLGISEADAEEFCQRLTQLGLFQDSGTPTAWSDGRLVSSFGFVHALYRELIFAELPLETSRSVNRRIAVVLAEADRLPGVDMTAHLAVMYANANMHAEAAAALRMNCIRSLGRYATRHAVQALQDSLKHLEQLPDTPEVCLHRMEACWDLTRLLPFDDGVTSVLVEALRDKILMLGPRVDSIRAKFLMHVTRCSRALFSGRADLAQGSMKDLEQAARGLGSHEIELIHLWQGLLSNAKGELAQALAAFDQCLGQPRQGAALGSSDTQSVAAFHRTYTLGIMGHFDEFETAFVAMDQAIGSKRNSYLQLTELYWLAEALRLIGCLTPARERYRELLRQCDEQESDMFRQEAEVGLLACGPAESRDLSRLTSLLEVRRGRRPVWSDHTLTVVMLDTLITQGCEQQALELLTQMEITARHWPFYGPELARAQARMAMAAGQHRVAIDGWRQALVEDIRRHDVAGLLRTLSQASAGCLLDPVLDGIDTQLRSCLAPLRTARLGHVDLQELVATRSGLSRLLD